MMRFVISLTILLARIAMFSSLMTLSAFWPWRDASLMIAIITFSLLGILADESLVWLRRIWRYKLHLQEDNSPY